MVAGWIALALALPALAGFIVLLALDLADRSPRRDRWGWWFLLGAPPALLVVGAVAGLGASSRPGRFALDLVAVMGLLWLAWLTKRRPSR